ncbi:MAG TPA: hemerythrin family protein [Gemmatimonadaceae bacterium]|nr:hemerythrin family protein [Gemmatimonadaceae bacterium]
MKWVEAYATGVPRIDEQHRMLFEMMDAFRAAFEEGRGERVYDNLLDSLAIYARTHFGFEERCMAECRCAAGDRNATAHRRFEAVVADFTARSAASGYRPADAAELMDVVDKWLVGHIVGIDTEMRHYAPLVPPGRFDAL